MVLLQAGGAGRRGIVLALHHAVGNVGRGRLELGVVDITGLRVHAPAGDAFQDKAVWHLDQHHGVQGHVSLCQINGQRLGLRPGARKAIENEPLGAIRSRRAFDDHRNDQFVGHQLAGLHEAVGLLAQIRAGGHRGAQHVATRNVRNLESFHQVFGLGSLARPWRTDQDQTHVGCSLSVGCLQLIKGLLRGSGRFFSPDAPHYTTAACRIARPAECNACRMPFPSSRPLRAEWCGPGIRS